MEFKKLAHLSRGTYGDVHICKYNKMIKAVKIVNFPLDDSAMLKSVIRETFILKSAKHKNVMSANDIFIQTVQNS